MAELDRKYRTEKTKEYIDVLKRGFDSTFKNGLAGVLFWEWGEPVSVEVQKAWSASEITVEDKEVCKFIQEYEVNEK